MMDYCNSISYELFVVVVVVVVVVVGAGYL